MTVCLISKSYKCRVNYFLTQVDIKSKLVFYFSFFTKRSILVNPKEPRSLAINAPPSAVTHTSSPIPFSRHQSSQLDYLISYDNQLFSNSWSMLSPFECSRDLFDP